MNSPATLPRTAPPEKSPWRRRSWFALPILLFLLIGAFLFAGIGRDPQLLPSPLIDKPAPQFSLPLLADPTRSWSPADMRGKVWLLNVWGSWCTACQVEHPVLLDLARRKEIALVGLAWKDMPDNAASWLKRLGNPYDDVVLDFKGRVAIDYGVYGAPETFLIDRDGVIRFKQVGPLTEDIIRQQILPLAQRLRSGS